MAESLDSPTTLIDKKFLKVPIDSWWLLFAQVFIQRMSTWAIDINLHGVKYIICIC